MGREGGNHAGRRGNMGLSLFLSPWRSDQGGQAQVSSPVLPSRRFFQPADWKTGAPHSSPAYLVPSVNEAACALRPIRSGDDIAGGGINWTRGAWLKLLGSGWSLLQRKPKASNGVWSGRVKLEHQAWSWVAIRRETSSFNNEWDFLRYESLRIAFASRVFLWLMAARLRRHKTCLQIKWLVLYILSHVVIQMPETEWDSELIKSCFTSLHGLFPYKTL